MQAAASAGIREALHSSRKKKGDDGAQTRLHEADMLSAAEG